MTDRPYVHDTRHPDRHHIAGKSHPPRILDFGSCMADWDSTASLATDDVYGGAWSRRELSFELAAPSVLEHVGVVGHDDRLWLRGSRVCDDRWCGHSDHDGRWRAAATEASSVVL